MEESRVVSQASTSDDTQREIEADLQFLLDAQADGLIRGLGSSSLEGGNSTGSVTPTVESVRHSSTSRQPKSTRRQPGLRSARKGIHNSIVALSALKDEELKDVQRQIEDNEKTSRQIDSWEKKRQGLQDASANVDSSEEMVRVQRLKQEADMLQADINKIELQLTEMKTRHRQLLRQAENVENAVQAKMASYSSSLCMLEEDIQKFLRLHDTQPTASANSRIYELPSGKLHPQGRNLETLRESLGEQRHSIQRQQERHEHEKSAYEEGASMWKEAVTEISALEKQLRAGMRRPTSPGSQSAWEDPPSNPIGTQNLNEILAEMDTVITSLEEKHRIAEERHWSLLIAAIGAELDALRQGKEILHGVLGIATESLVDTNGHQVTKSSSHDEIHELDKSFETARPLESRASDSGDDHDEPDPELLFSRQDADNE